MDQITPLLPIEVIKSLNGAGGLPCSMCFLSLSASIDHLERIIEQLSLYGPASTSIVFSEPMERRTITHALLDRAEGNGGQL